MQRRNTAGLRGEAAQSGTEVKARGMTSEYISLSLSLFREREREHCSAWSSVEWLKHFAGVHLQAPIG